MTAYREEVLAEIGHRLTLGLQYSMQRVHLRRFNEPSKMAEWMFDEHEEFREATDKCLNYWMANNDFLSHEDEEPIRQAHWRIRAAMDYLSIGADAILDHDPHTTPDEILRHALFEIWLPGSEYPRQVFELFSIGRTMFQQDH